MFLRLSMILALIAVLFGTYVRVAPTSPEDWHVDPTMIEEPGAAGALMTYADSPLWDASPEELMATVQEIALSAERTTILVGEISDGHVTFETRSQIWGFPDYTTIKAEEVDGGTALSIYARLRYGQNDFGVNGSRLERWMDVLTSVLPPK